MLTKLKSLNAEYFPKKLFYGPQWLILGVNNVCNLHCKMCDVGTKNTTSNFAQNLVGSNPLNMPLELIKKVMDQAVDFYPQSKIGYAFTEPLVYPHLIESLSYAQSKNLYTSVTTNALTLKKNAENLCKTGLNDLFISLDGLQDIHNEIRGNKQSFQKAIEGIETLLAFNKRPKISIFCVITEWNVGHLFDFLQYFKNFPLERIGFMHTNFTPEHIAEKHNEIFGLIYPATASNVEKTDVESTDLKLLWEQILKIKKHKWPFKVSFSPEIQSQEKLEEFYLNPEILIGKRCFDAFSTIMIKSDGTVIPAHGRCYNLTIGNLYTTNLKEIWNSTLIANFRKTLIDNGGLLPACSRCCSAFAK